MDTAKVKSETAIPANVLKQDTGYYLAGKWRCPDSPTGAHHWCSNGTVSHLVCKWCGKEQEV